MDGSCRGRGRDAVGAAAALAGQDDPALIQFKLPSSAAYDDFESLGLNMDHGVENAGGGSIIVSAWATDEEQALVEARGYRAVGRRPRQVQHRPHPRRARAVDRRREAPPSGRSTTNAAGKAGKSAAPGTVRAQRGDFYENNVGRFISIEANTTQAQITCTNPTAGTGCSYTGPLLTAEWYDAAGNRMGSGNLTAYIDPDVNPDFYQYHYQSSGSATRATAAPTRRPSRSRPRTATSTRSPPRSGWPRPRPATPPTSCTTSTPATTTGPRSTRDARPRHRVPEHLQGL